MPYLLQKWSYNLQADINLFICCNSVLHRYNNSTELLRLFQKVKSHLVDHLRVVQIVKLDIVANLRNLTDVKCSILFDKVGLDLFPAFELDQVRLTGVTGIIIFQTLIDTYAAPFFPPSSR